MNKAIKSLQVNKVGIILIIITSVMTSLGQLFWKLGANPKEKIMCIGIGFMFYGVGTILMILAFRHGSFSVLHPMLACGYVFGLAWAKLFLGETITLIQGVGISLIIIAVILIGGGDE